MKPTNQRPGVDHETCARKRIYWSKSDALIHADIAERRSKLPMKVYRCPICRYWHMAKRKVNDD